MNERGVEDLDSISEPNVRTLAELQAECAALGLKVEMNGRRRKDEFVQVLREFHWRKDHPDKPLPDQTMPMLLGDWTNLDFAEAGEIEADCHAWILQPKLDGARALLHVEHDRVRISSRYVSETTYRLSEFQANVPHLTYGLGDLGPTILDGELVCPQPAIDTGSTTTATSLQATMAVLAAAPEKAQRIQDCQEARVRFYVFDILRFCGQDLTSFPLIDRQDFLVKALRESVNPYIELVPSFVVSKPAVHRSIVAAGGEGTVWKKADQPYEPGRRVSHWLKRKRELQVEAFATSCKAGAAERGHADAIGAVEFSVRSTSGAVEPIAWICGWTDADRKAMLQRDASGAVRLNPAYLGRRAMIAGQDTSAKAKRIRHARIVKWLDD